MARTTGDTTGVQPRKSGRTDSKGNTSKCKTFRRYEEFEIDREQLLEMIASLESLSEKK
ncbi:MAG: hypothetical protein GDA48_18315 [Hormoscilla sp. GM102CHS1]|nr:hypothetical protein [Hormoscilla sp. GM102CHS1]